MALAWNEIKDRALAFSREWAKAESEDADAKPFWIEFFNVFGITSRRIGSFEQKVKKLGDRDGYIDWLWKGNERNLFLCSRNNFLIHRLRYINVFLLTQTTFRFCN